MVGIGFADEKDTIRKVQYFTGLAGGLPDSLSAWFAEVYLNVNDIVKNDMV